MKKPIRGLHVLGGLLIDRYESGLTLEAGDVLV